MPRHGTPLEAGYAVELGGAVAVGVVVAGRLHPALLDVLGESLDVALGRHVLGLEALPEEGRNRDRGEDADDQHDHQHFDQREPTRIAHAREEGLCHGTPVIGTRGAYLSYGRPLAPA